MPRFPKFQRSERKGVPENSQSSQPEKIPTPNKAGFLGVLKLPSRSPSPRPPSPASPEVTANSVEATANSLGQSEQRKPSKVPQNHNNVVTESTGTLNRQDVSTPILVLEERNATSGGPDAAPHDLSETRAGKGLWAKAYDKLPNELKQHLLVDKQQGLEGVLKVAIDAKEANASNRLKLKWGDKEIDIQESADRLVGWIAKFKEVGDIAMQYNPIHAALPWAGVRFILLVCGTIPTLDDVLTFIL